MNRCSKEVECKAYQYKGTMVGNCFLIDTSISDGAMTFLVNQDTAIYKKGKHDFTAAGFIWQDGFIAMQYDG